MDPARLRRRLAGRREPWTPRRLPHHRFRFKRAELWRDLVCRAFFFCPIAPSTPGRCMCHVPFFSPLALADAGPLRSGQAVSLFLLSLFLLHGTPVLILILIQTYCVCVCGKSGVGRDLLNSWGSLETARFPLPLLSVSLRLSQEIPLRYYYYYFLLLGSLAS